MHLVTIPAWINLSTVALAAVLAAWRGDARCRIIAVAQLAAWIVASSACAASHYCGGLPWADLTYDSVVLGVCAVCAWRAERYWTVWATAFALNALISDALGFLPHVSGWSWSSATLIWTYLLSATLAWAALSEPRPRAATMS